MEPLRPYLVVLTIGVLGFAWYQKLMPITAEEIECACEDDKPSLWQTKRYLGLVTVFAALMLAFPSYSHMFYPDIEHSEVNTTGTLNLVSFKIEGMTCTGCEEHIKHAVSTLAGVAKSKASWENGMAEIVFDASEVKVESIVEAINETGYTIISKEVKPVDASILEKETSEIDLN
jgi:copper chaperone CopZ